MKSVRFGDGLSAERLADSQRIPSGFQTDSRRIPGGFPADSGRIPSGFRADSKAGPHAAEGHRGWSIVITGWELSHTLRS